MRGEPLAVGKAAWRIQQVEESCDQMAARDRCAMCRDLSRGDAVANVERLLQNGFDMVRPRGSWMRLGDLAAAADQMRQTGLMAGVVELPIRRPAVAHQHAGEIGAEHRCGFVKAASMLNRIDDGRRRREGPQPPELARDFPTRFIGTDDRTPAYLLTQGVVRRLRLPRRAMEGVGDSTGLHVKAE